MTTGSKLFWILSAVGSFPFCTQAYTSRKPPFLRRQDMLGIWKVTQPKYVGSSKDGTVSKTKGEDIVLRLNDDGTFDPYIAESEIDHASDDDSQEELHGILGRGGTWEYTDETLVLAAARAREGQPKHPDTVLKGKLVAHVSECMSLLDPTTSLMDPSESKESSSPDSGAEMTSSSTSDPTDNTQDNNIDVHLSIPHGQVNIGKFMYPTKHKAFFDEPMLFGKSSVGTFAMNQLLGNLNARLQQEEKEAAEKPVAKYHKKDFHNRTFYLTTTPHQVNQAYAAADKHYHEDQVLHDFRVLPITFYPNNTFAAIGTEKILRGRYGLTGESRDRLWFQVSLFGFGRSAPGSVYSEGRLLSHDDRRGYVGSIQEYEHPSSQSNSTSNSTLANQTLFFVEGYFYYGSDLRRAAKSNSMGTFTLQEIVKGVVDDEDEDDDSDDEYDEIDNMRQNLEIGWDESSEDAFQ